MGDGHTCSRGRSFSLHSMQFCPVLFNVCVESLSFKKTEEGQDLCALPLDPQLQCLKLLAFKVSEEFLAIHRY